MYWTDAGTDKIQRADLDGGSVEDLVTGGLSSPQHIALDVTGGKMYWTDAGTDKIQRADLNGSGVEDLVTGGLSIPSGIALDVAGGKMYWTDFGTDKIQRADLNGSNVVDLVTGGLIQPDGIALDVTGGKMYWVDLGTKKIQRADLDGSSVEDLVTGDLTFPRAIALDVTGGKMYWVDSGTDDIKRADLDGSSVETLVTGLGAPFGIALGEISANVLPVATGDSYTVAEGGTLSVGTGDGVLANDSDADTGDTLSAVLVSNVSRGSLTLTGDGSFSYTHDGSETTGDSFTYKANDGTGDSNVVTVSITVTPVNDLPVATGDSYTVAEGGTLSVGTGDGVLADDSDAENNTLSAAVVSDVSRGSLTLTGDGSFSYTHDGSDTTGDSFTYKANDGTGDSNVVTVSITVTPVNDLPVATGDSYTVAEGGTLSVGTGDGVLANDSDAENNTLSAAVVSNVSQGSLTLSGDGSFSYTHDGSETTGDSFTYKANDGTGDSNVVTVSITVTPVNDLPVATGDSYTVAEGGTLSVGTGDGVLANDSDADTGDTLSAAVVSDVSRGSLTLTGDGSFSYTHDGSETTGDSFTYKANDGTGDSNVVTVSITVTPVNDAPVLNATGGSLAYTENGAAAAIDPGLTVTDADSANLTGATVQITTGCAPAEDVLGFTDQLGISGSYTAASCTLTLSGAATVAAYRTALRTVTYANSSNNPSTTARTASFIANDGTATGSATRGITVTAVNDAPVLNATGGSLAYTENGAAAAIDPGLTVTDADSVNLTGATVQITTGCAPAEDVLGFTDQLGISGSYTAASCTLTLSGATTVAAYQTALRTVTYANSSNNPSTAARTASFIANDGTATGSSTRGITVTAVNDAPTITNQSLSVAENSANGTVVGTVAASDPEGDILTSSITAGNTGTAFAINSSTRQLTVADASQLDFEATPSFILTVRVRDTAGLSASATVTVNIGDVQEVEEEEKAFFDLTPEEVLKRARTEAKAASDLLLRGAKDNFQETVQRLAEAVEADPQAMVEILVISATKDPEAVAALVAKAGETKPDALARVLVQAAEKDREAIAQVVTKGVQNEPIGMAMVVARAAAISPQGMVEVIATAAENEPAAMADLLAQAALRDREAIAGLPEIVTIRDGSPFSGKAIAIVTGLRLLPEGKAYEGWFVSDDGERKESTGILELDVWGNGVATYVSENGENIFGSFNTFVITVEPVPDDDPGPSEEVALVHTIPAGGIAHIRHLMFSWQPNPPYTTGDLRGTPKGIAVGLKEQAEAALLHAGLSLRSGTAGDLAGTKAHAEHVMNIITGGDGTDADGNGQVENPGDKGPGVVGYAQDASDHARFALRDAPGDATIAPLPG